MRSEGKQKLEQDKIKNNKEKSKTRDTQDAEKKDKGGGKQKDEDVPMGLLSSLKVLATNKQYLCLLIGYFPVTVIRSGFSTWTPVMLKETHGLDLASSSMCLSAMEVTS